MRALRRLERAVEFDLGRLPPEQVIGRLEPFHGLTSAGPLVVHRRRDSSLAIRLTGGRTQAPPVLVGRLVQQDGSTHVVGVVREAGAGLVVPSTFVVLAVLLGLVGLAIAPFGGLLPALLVCLPATIAFGLLARSMFRGRAMSFAIDVAQLEAELRGVVSG